MRKTADFRAWTWCGLSRTGHAELKATAFTCVCSRHPDGSSEEDGQETSLGVKQHSSDTLWRAGRCRAPSEVKTGPKWNIPPIKLSGPTQTITNWVPAGRRHRTILRQSTNCGLFFLSVGITAENELTNTQTGCMYMFWSESCCQSCWTGSLC